MVKTFSRSKTVSDCYAGVLLSPYGVPETTYTSRLIAPVTLSADNLGAVSDKKKPFKVLKKKPLGGVKQIHLKC